MSGGSGQRLWPLSTPESPKQFHVLGGSRTLFQETALRVGTDGGALFAPPVVVCNVRHGALVKEQLAEIACDPQAVILEPFGRNTAAVAAIAAQFVAAHNPEALVLLLPSDHLVQDAAGFRAAVQQAEALAASHIVTFGVQPSGPETGYGYIKAGPEIADGVFHVDRFVEKPDVETARGYVAGGGYSWNAGIFLFAPRVLLDEMRAACPVVVEATAAALETATTSGIFVTLGAPELARSPSISLDVGVMEQTRLAAVAPCDVGWADVGSWSELWRVARCPDRRNALHGPVTTIDVTDSLVWSEGLPVGVIGLTDVIIVAGVAGVVVAPISRAQDVRQIVERMALAQIAEPTPTAAG
jgi:mannose-1-phosphate guanylyltransferase/mannose-6-phosphate isomerase